MEITMQRNKLGFIFVFVCLLMAVYQIAWSAEVDGWLVEKNAPAMIGELVAEGSKNHPGEGWTVEEAGLLQEVYWNVDPRCDETGVVAILERISGDREEYIVPPAPYKNGNCNDPVAALYTSRVFEVGAGDKASVRFGDDSTLYWFFFKATEATPTPMPTPTNTATATATATVAAIATATTIATDPPDIATPTDMPTATPTATPTVTPVPPIPPTSTPGLPIASQPPTNLEKGTQPSIRLRMYLPLVED